jgi:superfamily II DNA or RNA helicase
MAQGPQLRSFAEVIRPYLTRRALVSGERLFQAGRVTLLKCESNVVRAEVDDRGKNFVNMALEPDALRYGCNCYGFRRTEETCCHIWAVARSADAATGAAAQSGAAGDRDLDGALDPANGGAAFEDFETLESDSTIIEFRRSRPRTRRRWDATLEALRHSSPPPRGLREQAGAIAQALAIFYFLGPEKHDSSSAVTVETFSRRRRRSGVWSMLQPYPLLDPRKRPLLDPLDRRIASMVAGAGTSSWYGYGYFDRERFCEFAIPDDLLETILPLLCETGRFKVLDAAADDAGAPSLRFDGGPPWELFFRVQAAGNRRHLSLNGGLRRGEDEIPLSDLRIVTRAGWAVAGDRLLRFIDHQAAAWIPILRDPAAFRVPAAEADRLLRLLHELPSLPPIEWPEELRPRTIQEKPQPLLRVLEPQRDPRKHPRLRVELSFEYQRIVVRAGHPSAHVYLPEERLLCVRDHAVERTALEALLELGCRFPPASVIGRMEQEEAHELELAPARLSRLVRDLLARGWRVEAEGVVYRRPGRIKIDVRSGIDWFDVDGAIDFDGLPVPLPLLIQSLRRGQNTVLLGDGTIGVLPEEWLKRFGILLGTGKVEGESVRFRPTQVGIVDALAEDGGEVSWDEAFERARKELRTFHGIGPAKASASFEGTLRPYQEDGLGWLEFLERFRFGGCLADDMGLGKTVQVLAFLDKRRGSGRPSLAVVPRSLIFNWRSEAARFAPELRVLTHWGPQRVRERERLLAHDLVLTTYGTLRRDVLFLRELEFDYVILDEAQAIKNAASESARAACALNAERRLAVSGTPIENHLGELWSLFEFLNPGMLGSAKVFKGLASLGGDAAEASFELLARATRPFILRRTKAEVLTDLPAKVEQTIICELSSRERRLYDELRDHYRQALLKQVERFGLQKSKIQVLEALLRLRQAACHPGLLDKERRGDPSAKLELVLEQIRSVAAEGHKCLVFSQFTRFLGILRERLDGLKVAYEYLDGKTRDRESRVRRFQEDDACKVFLISLKAGGLGLNLTAAEYVFLLDPWWNPAVESQAIDRAHRIGQARQVFAYRLIARGTVEEKVLELQSKKRRLAEAVISGKNSLIRELTREDIEALLS